MQATSNAGSLEGLLLGVLLTRSHETRHLLLGEINLSTAKGREVDVCDLHSLCQQSCHRLGTGAIAIAPLAPTHLELLRGLTHFDEVLID